MLKSLHQKPKDESYVEPLPPDLWLLFKVSSNIFGYIWKLLFQFPFVLHNFQQLCDLRVSHFLATLTLYFELHQKISFVLEDDPFEVKLRDNYAVCCYSLPYCILLHSF